jgi:NNP family nitrate/nitrite transporter-like MFS transporter
VLCLAAIPTACTGLVNTAGGLYALRFFIGMAGGSFVVCQFWSTIMFAPEVVGAANGFIGGWGNLGGGVTQLVIGTGLMPLFLRYMDADMAWRTISIIPAVLAIVTGIIVFFISDDYPSTSGSFKRSLVLRKTLSKSGTFEHKARVDEAFMTAAKRSASWILLLHYMFSFGIELTMLGCIGQYFTDVFGIPNHQASAVASIFGWMNVFARGAGGWISDLAYHKIGMKGRYIVHAICLAMEGVFVLVLGVSDSFAGALTIMIFFSIAVQASEGTTFAIVPFVDKKFPGAVSGIVSSGGNLGGLLFTSLLLIGDSNTTYYQLVFYVMGACCLASVPLAFFVRVEDVVEGEMNKSTVGNNKCTEKNENNGARRQVHFDDPSETGGVGNEPTVSFAVGDVVTRHRDV